MDPNATLLLIADCLEAGDRNAAIEAAEDLRGWIFRGGFEPDWSLSAPATKFYTRLGF